MTRLDARRTRVAIALSLFGAALPWPFAAAAAERGAAPYSATAEQAETTVRGILGLGVDRPPRPQAASLVPSPSPSAAPMRRSAAHAKASHVPNSRLDAKVLGLDGSSGHAVAASHDDATVVADVAGSDDRRIRSILGLGAEANARERPTPFGEPERRLVARIPATSPTRRVAAASDAAPAPAARTEAGAAVADSPRLEDAAAADAPAADTADRDPLEVATTARLDVEPQVDGIAALLQERDRRRPRGPRHDEPNPVIADGAAALRRSDGALGTSLLLPPDELETLDDVLRVRLAGRFRFDPSEASDGEATPAPVDDPLLALLDALSARAPDARHAPIIYVAPNPDDIARPSPASAVFEQLAASLERLPQAVASDASQTAAPGAPANTASTPSNEPLVAEPVAIAAAGTARGDPAVRVAPSAASPRDAAQPAAWPLEVAQPGGFDPHAGRAELARADGTRTDEGSSRAIEAAVGQAEIADHAAHLQAPAIAEGRSDVARFDVAPAALARSDPALARFDVAPAVDADVRGNAAARALATEAAGVAPSIAGASFVAASGPSGADTVGGRSVDVPPVAARAPRLLPVDPFTWDGQDTIDVFASLAGHPLLVAESQRVVDRAARAGNSANKRPATPSIAAPTTGTSDEGAFLWAAAARGPSPSTHVDIFDANVALAYAADGASRPAAVTEGDVSAGERAGTSDTLSPAPQVSGFAGPQVTGFGAPLASVAPIDAPTTLAVQPLMERLAPVALPDVNPRRPLASETVIAGAFASTGTAGVSAPPARLEAARLAPLEPVVVEARLARQPLLSRIVVAAPTAAVAPRALPDEGLIARAFGVAGAARRPITVGTPLAPLAPRDDATFARQPLLALQAVPALPDPKSFDRRAEVDLAIEPTVRAVQRVLPTAEAPVAFEADDDRLKALRGDHVAIADTQLDTMRGGFETDAGLKISFGIERAVYINGALVTSTALTVTDLSRLTAGQVQSAALDRTTLGVIQSGPNNTFSPAQLGASNVGTVIQNTLNDQKIQGVTQISATVNSLDLVGRTNIQQNIQNALQGSIRH